MEEPTLEQFFRNHPKTSHFAIRANTAPEDGVQFYIYPNSTDGATWSFMAKGNTLTFVGGTSPIAPPRTS